MTDETTPPIDLEALMASAANTNEVESPEAATQAEALYHQVQKFARTHELPFDDTISGAPAATNLNGSSILQSYFHVHEDVTKALLLLSQGASRNPINRIDYDTTLATIILAALYQHHNIAYDEDRPTPGAHIEMQTLEHLAAFTSQEMQDIYFAGCGTRAYMRSRNLDPDSSAVNLQIKQLMRKAASVITDDVVLKQRLHNENPSADLDSKLYDYMSHKAANVTEAILTTEGLHDTNKNIVSVAGMLFDRAAKTIDAMAEEVAHELSQPKR